MPAAVKKICFVISPIGDAGSETRKRSDQTLKHVIAPAAGAKGYKPLRADQISEPGIITSQVIQHIVDDPLVVADLIKRGEQIPFDVAPMRTVQVDVHDLDSVEEAKAEIEHQIEAVENDPAAVDTPISVSLDLQLLRQSEDPEDRSLADLLVTVSEMRAAIFAMEKRLASPEDILPPPYIEYVLNRSSSPQAAIPRGMIRDLRRFVDRLQSTAVDSESEAWDELREELAAIAAFLDRRAHLS